MKRSGWGLTLALSAALQGCGNDRWNSGEIEQWSANLETVADAGGVSSPDAAASVADGGSACVGRTNPGAAADGDINVDVSTELQLIRGFGGINVPGWIADLTPEQVDLAFGNGPGQLGLTLLRVRVPYDPTQFELEVPAAARAVSLGATVIASPWTPPPEWKTSGDIVGGELLPELYESYADHLLGFHDFMKSNGVPLYAISVQNEPDITVTYESCEWTPQQMASWLASQGSRFGATGPQTGEHSGETKLIAAESFNFNPLITDPILQDAAAAAEVDIIGGHIYGRRPTDYPLARSLGKELWMTEHYTDSANPANLWPLALAVGKEIHDSMSANFSAYIWWYIRRAYGLITEDGLASKRGYLMAQYSKFIRPGYVRVAATAPAAPDVYVTAYKGDGRLVIVAVNQSTAPQNVTLDADGACVDTFTRYVTSVDKNVDDDGEVLLEAGRATVTLEAQSVTTFVSE